jgi:hypothetical protein
MGGRYYLTLGGTPANVLRYGTQIVLDDYSSTTEYAFTVQNPTTNGLGVRIRASGGNNIATFNDAAVTLASADGTKTFVVANAGITASAITTTGGTYTTPTIATPTISNPTITGVGTFPAGSFGAPSAAWVDAGLGIYRAGANSLGIGSGTSSRTIKFGKGNPSLSMVEVVQDTANSATVTGATNATPIVITTSADHGYSTGEYIAVSGVGGNTAANGIWIITVLSSTTFSLNSSVGNGAYTSGGITTISPRYGFYSAQGSLPSNSVTPMPDTPGISSDTVMRMGGLTHVAMKGAIYAVDGSLGFAIGGDFQSIVPTGSYTSGTGSNSGTIGLRGVAHSQSGSTGQHVLTAAQFNAKGEKSNDIIHGVEINLSTLDSSPSTVPAHRIWAIMGNEASKRSRRASTLDAFMVLLRKRWPGASVSVTGATNATPIVITTGSAHGYSTGDTVNIESVGGNTAANGHWLITVLSSTTFSLGDSVGNGAYTSGGTSTLDDVTNVRHIQYGIYLGDGGGTYGNFPFDATSTFMASNVNGVMGGLIDLNNVHINDGSGSQRGPILRIGGVFGSADPTLDIHSMVDGSVLSGWVGIGMAPARPLSIKTASDAVFYFAGTVANYTTTSVGAGGGASAMPTPLGYLRVNMNGTLVLIPYCTNA